MEEALHGAAEVPLAGAASVLLQWLHAWTALAIPAKFASDLAVAKALTVAARAGVLENVRINLDSIQDEAFQASVEARLREVK